jgi:Immunoglobulin I-set domain
VCDPGSTFLFFPWIFQHFERIPSCFCLFSLVFAAKPDVRIEGASHGKSKSATKDEPFSITCVYSGEFPQAHLIWTFSTNDTNGVTILDQRLDDPFRSLLACPGNAEKNCSSSGYVFGRNTKIEQESATSEPGKPEAQNEKTSMLEFSSIQESDRGTYTCSIDNEHGRSTASVEVKVKGAFSKVWENSFLLEAWDLWLFPSNSADKLAALWPFLGIVAEVVILCAIIFIYEKRRNKTVDEEDENEPMKEDLNRDSHDAAVRSRKWNCPQVRGKSSVSFSVLSSSSSTLFRLSLSALFRVFFFFVALFGPGSDFLINVLFILQAWLDESLLIFTRTTLPAVGNFLDDSLR